MNIDQEKLQEWFDENVEPPKSNNMKIIPKGYIVEIESYENDADNYKMRYFDGLSKEEALFLKNIAEKFKSCNSKNNENCFGNDTKPLVLYNYDTETDEVLTWFRNTFDTIPEITDCYKWNISDDDDIYDCLEIVIGTWADGENFRYVKDYNIVYNPSEIIFSMVDNNLNVLED